MSRPATLLISLVALAAAACVPAHTVTSASTLTSPSVQPVRRAEEPVPRGELTCNGDCDAVPPSPELAHAIETRIADLEARGGVCSRYGTVLEQSYRSGRITIRPYMWRVGTRLTSGEAKPNGEMTLAREIDPLNVGVRTVDDVIRTMEHEAVHIALDLRDGLEGGEDDANRYVRSCRSETVPAS